MQLSCGMIFVFLFLRLQWNKSSTEGSIVKENNGNSSVRENDQSTVQRNLSKFILAMNTTINPSTVTALTSDNKNLMKREFSSSSPKSTSLNSTDGTTLSSNVTMVPTNSATNFNRTSAASVTLVNRSELSGVTTTDAAPSTATPNNSTAPSSTAPAPVLPSDNSATTLSPTSTTLTSPMVKQDSPTTNLNPLQQTTEQNHSFSSPLTASFNSEDAEEGAILVSILIGLIEYFLRGKKRSEPFSHSRLYDDSRNDPVLDLDNSLGPYDPSFGCVSDTNASTTEESNPGCPSDGIPMDDMTPPHNSP
ncbi:mucin-15 isoform X2 [Heliangelus exortis]|uniref:mucin-15 isoform X2 n=1 Tax=Heliangelus exortis TaxID=472823 RepID=UPI003A914955